MKSFRRFAWFCIGFCLLVILWGAFVRASGSGAGCGDHWPLCDGEIIPLSPTKARLIEFTHRLTSGLSLIFVFALYLWARKIFPKGFTRSAALFSFVAICIEALIGAGIVLMRLVELDQSNTRVFSIAIHLVNTLFLMGALGLTAFSVEVEKPNFLRTLPRKEFYYALALLLGFALLGAFGALTALGDTLFKPTSHAEAWSAKFKENAHITERLRLLHPVFAVAWSALLVPFVSQHLYRYRRQCVILLSFVAANLLIGAANVWLHAPNWMQMTHLFFANAIWLSFLSLLFFCSSSGWQKNSN